MVRIKPGYYRGSIVVHVILLSNQAEKMLIDLGRIRKRKEKPWVESTLFCEMLNNWTSGRTMNIASGVMWSPVSRMRYWTPFEIMAPGSMSLRYQSKGCGVAIDNWTSNAVPLPLIVQHCPRAGMARVALQEEWRIRVSVGQNLYKNER